MGTLFNSRVCCKNKSITSISEIGANPKFLLTGIGENLHFYVKTRDVEQLFDFEKKADFINFMYNTWEEKIDMYYMRMGGLLLDQRNYYEARRKLFKKYYKKF